MGGFFFLVALIQSHFSRAPHFVRLNNAGKVEKGSWIVIRGAGIPLYAFLILCLKGFQERKT